MRKRDFSGVVDEYRTAEIRKKTSVFDGSEKSAGNVYDVGVYLFSIARTNEESDLSSGQISWDISGSNYNVPISNCVKITMGPTTIPIPYSLDPARPPYFIKGKVFVELAQLPINTGYAAGDGVRYHYECNVEATGQGYVVLNVISGPIYLARPLPSITEITLRFYRRSDRSSKEYKMRRVTLLDDQVTAEVTPASNPAEFTIITGNASAIGPVGATFTAPNVEVWLSGYSTDDPVFNETVNDNYFAVTQVGPGPRKVFIAGLSAAAVTSAGSITGSMYIPKNDVGVSIRFTCLSQKATNLFVPTHV